MISAQANAIVQAKRATSEALRLVDEIRSEVRPGRCPWCDAPIPPNPRGRKLKRCRAPECERAYYAAYRSMRYVAARMKGGAAK